jgi:hypothetical protein
LCNSRDTDVTDVREAITGQPLRLALGLHRCTFRMNLSRRGAGWSVGVPGVRYGRSATGAAYVSVGFPGLGLYWLKYLGGGGGQRQIPTNASRSSHTVD